MLNIFDGCKGLTSITIPSSVTGIGYYTFSSCSNLTSVTIPNSMKYISSHAFYYCSSLTSVTIPNNVTSIGEHAFGYCSSLISITIGNSVTNIGISAFSECPKLTSVKVEMKTPVAISISTFSNRKNATLYVPSGSKTAYRNANYWKEFKQIVEKDDASGYCGDNLTWKYVEATGTLTISGSGAMENYTKSSVSPWYGYQVKKAVIEGGVTNIGEFAFYNCSALTSVTIGNSVTSIERDAFWNCSSLTSVIIPNSVTSIENWAFENCSGLTSVTIPNSVKSIGDYAFYSCSGLTSVTIGNSVTSIGSYAFDNCSGLTSIIVESGNKKYDSRNNCNALIETSSNTLILGCKNTIIPNSVTGIGDDAFRDCSGLTSVTIGNSVTSIGRDAFYNCSGLTSVTIPYSVTSIGDGAFSGCSNLTTVTVENKTPVKIDYNTFTNRKNATLYVPSGCKAAYMAADYWKEFREVIQPTSGKCGDNLTWTYEEATQTLTISGNGAMYSYNSTTVPWYSYCGNIKKAVIGGSVTSIGNYAFSDCSSLATVTIPNSVTSIGGYAFRSCSNLSNLTIGKNVTSIGNYAFYDCPKLTSVTVEMKAPVNISYSTFSNRKNATLYVPSGCKAAYAAASYWNDFKEIIEPNSGKCGDNLTWAYEEATQTLTISGSGAMYSYNSTTVPWYNYCGNIKKAVIGGSVTNIGNYAFSGCSNLTTVTIPNSVMSIGDYAFRSCYSLPNVTISKNVTSIGNYAFFGCSGLASIKIETGNTKYDSRNNCNAIIEISTNKLILGCKNTIIPYSVTSIEKYAFSNSSGLTSVTIPISVMSIGDYAFYGCI